MQLHPLESRRGKSAGRARVLQKRCAQLVGVVGGRFICALLPAVGGGGSRFWAQATKCVVVLSLCPCHCSIVVWLLRVGVGEGSRRAERESGERSCRKQLERRREGRAHIRSVRLVCRSCSCGCCGGGGSLGKPAGRECGGVRESGSVASCCLLVFVFVC